MTVPDGNGRIAPRVHTPADVVAASSRSSPRPTARARSTASGRRSSSDSAPSSTGTPATSLTRSFPPTWSAASSTVTRSPGGPSRRRNHAAASPEIPPPTTTTCRDEAMSSPWQIVTFSRHAAAEPRPRTPASQHLNVPHRAGADA